MTALELGMGFSRVYISPFANKGVAPVSCPKSTVLWMAQEENRRASYVRASRHIHMFCQR